MYEKTFGFLKFGNLGAWLDQQRRPCADQRMFSPLPYLVVEIVEGS
jgi:hypothetical protein